MEELVVEVLVTFARDEFLRGIALGPDGYLLVCCASKCCVFRLDLTSENKYSVFIGSPGESGSSDSETLLCAPQNISFSHRDGGVLYIADNEASVIKQYSYKTGKLSVLVDRSDLNNKSNGFQPTACPINAEETILALSDERDFIYLFSLKDRTVIKTYNSLSNVVCLDFIDSSSTLYVSTIGGLHAIDISSNRTKFVDICGNRLGKYGYKDGPLLKALFRFINDFVKHPESDLLYLADSSSGRIRICDRVEGLVSTFAGTEVAEVTSGTTLTASFDWPYSLVWNEDGDLIVASGRALSAIRKVFEPSDRSRMAEMVQRFRISVPY